MIVEIVLQKNFCKATLPLNPQSVLTYKSYHNTVRAMENDRYSADDTLKSIFWKKNLLHFDSNFTGAGSRGYK